MRQEIDEDKMTAEVAQKVKVRLHSRAAGPARGKEIKARTEAGGAGGWAN